MAAVETGQAAESPAILPRISTDGDVVIKNVPTDSELSLLRAFSPEQASEMLKRSDYASLVFGEVDVANLLANLPPAEGFYRSFFYYQVVPSIETTPRVPPTLHTFDSLTLAFYVPEFGTSGRIGVYAIDGMQIGVAAKPKFGDIPPSDRELYSGILSVNPLPPRPLFEEDSAIKPIIIKGLQISLQEQLNFAYGKLVENIPGEIQSTSDEGSMRHFLDKFKTFIDTKSVVIRSYVPSQETPFAA